MSATTIRAMTVLAAAISVLQLPAATPGYSTLIAHRGESLDAPDNKLPVYRMAVERGSGFECDIYLSSDGRLYTFHDSDLKRTTGGANTNACTAVDWKSTVSKLNVGGWGKWKGSKFDPTRPALLEEVLALAHPSRKIYVEVKGDNPSWVPCIKKAFAKEPKATPDTVLFIAFGRKVCAELKRQMPEFKTYWLTAIRSFDDGVCRETTADEIVTTCRMLGVDGVDARYIPEIVTADFIKTVHEAGLEFHVWTVDIFKDMVEAFSRGVDTVTTNCAKKQLDEWIEAEHKCSLRASCSP